MKLVCFACRRKFLIIWLLICTFIAVLMIFPDECRNGGTNGTYLCIQVLIPSLFPFMFITNFVVCSGLILHSPRILRVLCRFMFSLPDVCSSVVIMSMLGGYPTGAAGIGALYNKGYITKTQARKMALFCVASGPGFLVTYTGSVMLGSPESGYILLASQCIAFILIGVITRFIITDGNGAAAHPEKLKTKSLRIGASITEAVSLTIKSSSYMCGFVVLFSVFFEVFISLTTKHPNLQKLSAFIEITNGIKILAGNTSVVTIAFFCGFGGLCVHFQIFQLLSKTGVNKLFFYLMRILQGIFSATATYLLIRIFPQSQEVFSTIKNAKTTVYSEGLGCVFLILSCVIFLISLRYNNKEISFNRR